MPKKEESMSRKELALRISKKQQEIQDDVYPYAEAVFTFGRKPLEDRKWVRMSEPQPKHPTQKVLDEMEEKRRTIVANMHTLDSLRRLHRLATH